MIENDNEGLPSLVSRWRVGDVLSIRPDLTQGQAVQVLIEADRNFDAEIGVNWDVLKDIANEVHPRSRVQEAYDNAAHSFEEQEWSGAGAWLADYFAIRLEEDCSRSEMDAKAIRMMRELPWPGDS